MTFLLGTSLSGTYAALLTWLLSLVPDDFTPLHQMPNQTKPPQESVPPFYVISLQQMFMEVKKIVAQIELHEVFSNSLGWLI